MKTFNILVLVFLILSRATRAEPSSFTDEDMFPACVNGCTKIAYRENFCQLEDQQCACETDGFRDYFDECLKSSCTVPEALAAKNISLTRCDAPLRDRSAKLVTTSSSMASVAGLLVIVRFATKLYVVKVQVGLDDWFVLAAMISSIPSAFINVYGLAANGLGRDMWTLEPEAITEVLMYFQVMACMYFLDTTLVKLSMICFYQRIFPSPGTQRLLWGTFTLTSAWGALFILLAVFQCRPIQFFWTQWDGLHEGSCLDANAIAWSNAATNIALDAWILIIPLWHLRSLQLHRMKKIGVGLMFCVGTFVTVVSVMRLQSLVAFAKTPNSTWDFFDVCVWSTIEVTVGIMCACLPAVRQLVVRTCPSFGKALRTKTDSVFRQVPETLPTVGVRGTRTTIYAPNSRVSSNWIGNPQDIHVHRTYSVHFGKEDGETHHSLPKLAD